MDRKEENNQEPKSFYQDNRRVIKSFVFTVAILGAFAWANLGLNVFTTLTPISSADVNQNFQLLEQAILNPKSDISFKNSGAYTMDEACTTTYAVIVLDTSSGLDTTAYNTTTGAITPAVTGGYEVSIVVAPASPVEDIILYLCSDANETPDCAGATKITSLYSVWAKTTDVPKVIQGTVYLENGNTYKLLHNRCKAPFNSFAAGQLQISMRLIR